MPCKKRSTAVQRSRRVTRMRESCDSTTGDKGNICSTPKKNSAEHEWMNRIPANILLEAKAQLALEMQNEMDEYEKGVLMFKLSLNKSILNAPLSAFREYREEHAIDVIESDHVVENQENRRTSRRLRSSSVDRFKKPALIVKAKQRVSRSLTRPKASVMKTPDMSHFQCMTGITPITPKFNMNTPVSVLRHPRIGEQAVSLTGSPLLVSVPADGNPTVNVPLSDGKVMTILPLNNFNNSNLPMLDAECRDKLQSIHKYLEKMLGNNWK